jgi:hypothetical protein
MSRIVKVVVQARLHISDDCDVEREILLGKYFCSGIPEVDDEMILPKDGDIPSDENYFRILNYDSINVIEEQIINDNEDEND